ncbi:ALF repeat-containing protein [Streptomyces sp. NBC_00963]|uniref:ALF repeat-containing protein n=1 Tax=Streptomyces sp. NBC_00963 TaxID=2903697 RepID=UPI003865FA38|nr:ALF repeat-containing protein [Streptomyces sp. NBC_00963]
MKTRGPWVSQAAADALGGTDQDVITFLRSGWDTAVQDETRDAVSELSTTSPYESVRTAAAKSLKGDAKAVTDFYTTGQYTSGATDMEVAVSKVVKRHQRAGGR